MHFISMPYISISAQAYGDDIFASIGEGFSLYRRDKDALIAILPKRYPLVVPLAISYIESLSRSLLFLKQ